MLWVVCAKVACFNFKWQLRKIVTLCIAWDTVRHLTEAGLCKLQRVRAASRCLYQCSCGNAAVLRCTSVTSFSHIKIMHAYVNC